MVRASVTRGCGVFGLAVALAPALVWGQNPAGVMLQVSETAGIRRNFYPVHAVVSLPQGALMEPTTTRLVSAQTGEEVGVQVIPASRWPDGSVESLLVDFNLSLGPEETRSFRFEYGPNVVMSADPGRGLSLVEASDVVQVGRIRFGTNANPLVLSVAYRDEAIAPGVNGFVVEETDGTRHALGGAEVDLEIVREGPLYVELRYIGEIALGSGNEASYVIAVEMPNSKSWVKTSLQVDDPDQRLRTLSFHSPLALGSHPWVWDFGTDRWTYGVLRNVDSSVVLTNEVEVGGLTRWWVDTGPKGQERLYETTGETDPVLPGWGHLQGAGEVVAFAVDQFGATPGTYRITLDGAGQASFEVIPSDGAIRQELAVYQHFVSTPVQIGAATSPPSMLAPLVVRVR